MALTMTTDDMSEGSVKQTGFQDFTKSYLVLSGDGLDEAHREVSYFPMGEREVKVPVSNVHLIS